MISRDLLSKYDSIVASLNTGLGEQIICYYATGVTGVVNNVSQMFGSNHFDAEGNSLQNGDYAGSAGYNGESTRTVYSTGIVYARTYVETNSFRLASYNIPDPTNIWQINCQVADIPRLTQAEYIEIEPRHKPNTRIKAVMVKAPMPYGLSHNSCYGFWRAT
jgi:hypothetical protein